MYRGHKIVTVLQITRLPFLVLSLLCAYPFFCLQLTLPTGKAGGFLFQPLQHLRTPYGIATSYTVSTS